ncbi:hypothetical protein EXIGLDRAFT_841071 [Exidia glandulosa HHB12029]|uniref:Fe2OG dioxygenase domain-containing protein n=1 Tax=Exidia glandulosa HHB12029 TaxID=1314781 RepID=A0A165E3K1_EXIGL|nr:hypothetical protein EXIGLDRAFT_841071 [Exidia glandulosa HHB12029]
MLKRKASVQLSPSKLDEVVSIPGNKRPRLTPIITVFERRPALNVVDLDDSAPSPLEYPWMEWPWDDDDDDVDSLFDELPAVRDNPAGTVQAFGNVEGVVNDDDDEEEDEVDSLFDEPAGSQATCPSAVPDDAAPSSPATIVARRTAAPIPGLYFDDLCPVPEELASSVLAQLTAQYFSRPDGPNQIMLFTRPSDSLPAPLDALLATVSDLFRPSLSKESHDLLFAPRGDGCARQAIVNRYAPGEGIASHVDLLGRYGDGIVGVSLGAGCAMAFAPLEEGKGDPCEMWLPPRSMIALEGDARYKWTHGIAARSYDIVQGENGSSERIERGTRVSVTFRWMLPGAHVVGDA